MSSTEQGLVDENGRLRDDLEKCREELTTANLEKERLSQDLDVLKSRLLELMPRSEQVSESSIVRKYKGIYSDIDNWMDYIRIDEKGFFKTRYISTVRNIGNKERFIEAGIDPDLCSAEFLEYLIERDTCQYVVLSLLISEFLCRNIFRQVFPAGFLFRPEQLNLIDTVKICMAKASTKEEFDFGRWRSEMCRSLTAPGYFDDDDLKKSLDNMFDSLLQKLEFWLGEGTLSKKHQIRLRDQVFDPAVKLHNILQCSPQSYRIDTEQRDSKELQSRCMTEGSWRFKNMFTWKAAERDDLDYAFACLAPRLYIEGEGDEARELVQATILAWGQEEGQRRRSSISVYSIAEASVPASSSDPASAEQTYSHMSNSQIYQKERSKVASHKSLRRRSLVIASPQQELKAPGRSSTVPIQRGHGSHKNHSDRA